MLIEGHVGASGLAAEGSQVDVSFDRTKALRVSKNAEEALKGDLFFASVAATGVSHATSLTTTAPFALYNPDGNDVDLVVHGVTFGYVSGTLGAGFLAAAQYVETSVNAAPTGTAIVAQGATRLGLGSKPRARPLETVTLSAAPTLIFPVKDIAPKLATTATETGPNVIWLPVPIVVPPKTALVLAGVCGAGGDTPLVVLGAIWQEVKRLV